MYLILFRHGIAEEKGVKNDFDRELVEKGKKKVKLGSRVLEKLIDKEYPVEIWSSHKKRAAQTAKLLKETLKVKDIEYLDSLTNGDFAEFKERLKREKKKTIVCVGHSPDIDIWLGYITGMSVELKKAGLAVIRLDGEKEITGELILLIQPKGYEMLI